MSKKKVLIVDDQANWLDLFTELLEEEFDVATAKSYSEGMKALLTSDSPFHVVISDIRLEDEDRSNEDGLRLLAELDKVSDLTQSVVVTGYPSIRTAKESLVYLKSFEYILKFPEDGRGFDYNRFRQVVREAAEEAEKQRPASFVPSDNRVLVVENEAAWLNRLSAILEYEKYRVNECSNLHELLHVLLIKSYDLIVLNYEFTSQDPLLLTRIREHQSDVEILLMAREIDITQALRMVQNRKIFSVIMLDDSFDEHRFRVTLYRALDPRNRQYVLASIKETAPGEQLQVGQNYTVVLTMQSKPSNEGVSLRLAPRARRQSLRLRVVVYAQDMQIGPREEVYWEIPFLSAPTPIEFRITPKMTGRRGIYFDFQEGEVWRGRLIKEVEISSKREEQNLQPRGEVTLPTLQ